MRFSFLTFIAYAFLFTQGVIAQTPLHQQIDEIVESGTDGFEKHAAEIASDAEFLRRIYLDLIGTIPSGNEVREFLADESTEKREKLIDRLLESPHHARRMQYVVDSMLMERRPDKNVTSAEWQKYLRESFLSNKHWDRLVAEILSVDGSNESTRPAAKFLLDRELKAEDTTRDLGRIFLGRDLQCAQCHDHPNVDGYLQRHYHGLTAFLNRSFLFKDPKSKKASIGEKADGVVKFTSVFTDESAEIPPRMLDLPAIDEPPTAKEPYLVKPGKTDRAIPIYSRRLQLSVAMTDPANTAFRLNIANRIWAMMLGRGIVEPVDMWHAGNPPSNPKLISSLADSFADHDYDLRYLLREIARSKTYQRSSRRVANETIADESFAVGLLKPLSPEQLAWSMMQATGLVDETMTAAKAKQKDMKLANDPKWQEETTHETLKSHVATFVTTFGVVGAQASRFDASADQALFLRNGNLLQTWLAPSGTRLTARLKSLEGDEFVNEFYFSVFSRPPSTEELEQIKIYLDQNKDNRDAATQQLVWAALTSAEFRFNH